jgi:hypothetical protein
VGYEYKPYVSAADRRKKAAREAAKRAKKGHTLEPVAIEGRAIAGRRERDGAEGKGRPRRSDCAAVDGACANDSRARSKVAARVSQASGVARSGVHASARGE